MRTGLFYLTLLLMGGVGPINAQEIPERLTLEDALRLARQRNPALLRSQAQADATGADIRAGIGSFLPRVEGGLSFTGSSLTRVTGEDDFGQPVELPSPITFQSSGASQTVGASLTLFDGFRNVNTLKAARAGAAALDRAVDAEALRLDAEITRRFYDARRAQLLVEIEQRLLAARREELAATERLFGVAGQTQVDVLGAEIEVARQEQSLERARGDARKATLTLAQEMGIEGEAGFEPVGDFPSPFDVRVLDTEALVRRAIARHPRIEVATARVAEADYQTGAARAVRWPTLEARGSFTRFSNRNSYDALFDLNPKDRNVGFSLTASIPLFSGFQTSQTIARAAASEEAAREDLREERLRLEREVRSAIIDLGNAFRTVQLARRSAELGRRRVEMAREQYRAGSLGFTELQQIVTRSADDERQALTASMEFATALATVQELVGERIQP